MQLVWKCAYTENWSKMRKAGSVWDLCETKEKIDNSYYYNYSFDSADPNVGQHQG